MKMKSKGYTNKPGKVSLKGGLKRANPKPADKSTKLPKKRM